MPDRPTREPADVQQSALVSSQRRQRRLQEEVDQLRLELSERTTQLDETEERLARAQRDLGDAITNLADAIEETERRDEVIDNQQVALRRREQDRDALVVALQAARQVHADCLEAVESAAHTGLREDMAKRLHAMLDAAGPPAPDPTPRVTDGGLDRMSDESGRLRNHLVAVCQGAERMSGNLAVTTLPKTQGAVDMLQSARALTWATVEAGRAIGWAFPAAEQLHRRLEDGALENDATTL